MTRLYGATAMDSLIPRLSRIRVVLVDPTYTGNLGQVARAMRNFGLSRLALVGGAADPGADEARWWARAEGGEVLDRAQRFPTLAAAVADCRLVIGASRRVGRDRGPGAPVGALLASLRPWRQPWDTALVFGGEASGLPNSDLDLCQHQLWIPADPAAPSLNLAHAVAVVGFALAEAARADLVAAAAAPAEAAPAPHDVLEAMYAQARRVWVRIGYIQTPDPDTMLRRWRRILGRARLTESDVRVVRALLHQTDWCAEVAGVPPGGAKTAPPGFFDKHQVRLTPQPGEHPTTSAGRCSRAAGGEPPQAQPPRSQRPRS